MRLLRRCSLLLIGLVALTVSPRSALPQGTVSSGRLVVTVGGWTKNPVPSGQTTTASLSATATNPDAGPYCTYSAPTWNWTTVDAPLKVTISQPAPASSSAILQATIPNPGVYRFGVTATATWTNSCGGSVSDSATVPCVLTVVGVQNLQYLQPIAGGGGNYTDVTKTLFVLVGKSVTFKALPNPVGSTFPNGNPIWSGSSGATGTGATKTVTFNMLSTSVTDFKTVTATCGTTSATANVIVLDLIPIVTPWDNFVGRDLDNWGVCELIDLSFSTNPSGIGASDIGGLRWLITTGGGVLTGGVGGVGAYQCADVADTVVLSLLVTGGPMLGEKKDAPAKEVIPPDAITMNRDTDFAIGHKKGNCSLFFFGVYYASAKKLVSFLEIEVREGTGKSVAEGAFKTKNGLDHMPGKWDELDGPNALKYYKWKTLIDEVGFDMKPPFAVGIFTWPIEVMFRKKLDPLIINDNLGKKFATATQKMESSEAGKATVSKAGSVAYEMLPIDVDSGFDVYLGLAEYKMKK